MTSEDIKHQFIIKQQTGFQARSKDLRGGRWSWTLTFAQKRSWVGRWSWAEQVGRLLLRVVQVVRQQRCNGHCLSDCPAQQLKEQLHSAQVAGQWRGDTALTLPLFWRRSTVSPVFFGRFPRSSLSLSRPLPTLSPSLIGHLASVDVKQHESKQSKQQTSVKIVQLESVKQLSTTSRH